ncbi:MAG TPA: 23S rRNA (adenine(2503)-C(2))-methyltransferase RlmN [Polyangia bacterium]|nr:23S rRNA (adenine(2503)-C(2))-methyltransferase RlmN [Polyangia bacterium]
MPKDLRSFSPAELAQRVKAAGHPSYRSEQIFRWLHGQGVDSWDAMTNVPPALRQALSEDPETAMAPLTLADEQLAADGTRKMRFRTEDGRSIESVLIPEEHELEPREGNDAGRDKLTLCVSSQVGCALDCGFCATATLGFGRNLTAGEIVQQVYIAAARAGRRPTNLVFMGMGEPMHNFEQVVKAIALLIHPWGLAMSPRRITVSTAGLVPKIAELGQLSPAPNLAISLNATTDEVRDRIMPINRKYPIATLLEAARAFPLAHGKKVTFEYVLLAGVNDSDADAERLPRLLAGIPCMVNLIPWNPFNGPQFQRPSAQRIRTFQETLRRRGMQSFIRTPRGDDIDAACGQLAARATPDLVPLRSTRDAGPGPGAP